MKYILLLISFVLISFNLSGQTEQRPYRHFATQEVHARLLKEDPNFSKELLKIERKISKNNKIENHLKEGFIPLYFHILYNNEEERVGYEQIISQIEALNEDFALSLQPDLIDIQSPYGYKENGKTKQYKIELSSEVRPLLDIKFCLAEPNGNASKKEGINYISTKVKEWDIDDAIKFKSSDGSNIVQPNKYINIWIGHLKDGNSGYAQMPGGPNKTDGIVIDYRFFGLGGTAQPPYDLGRTLTHLVGNYLGLFDLWDENNRCGDDKIEDTPLHKNPNYGCPQYVHVSSCIQGEVEMTMNFMDNTDDACQSLFTVGQMKRMYSMLAPEGPRNTILNNENQCSQPNNLSESAALRITRFTPKVQISPNPAMKSTNLTVIMESEQKGIVNVYSSIGNLVYSNKLQFIKGYNELTIETDEWGSGIFFLHLQINKEKIVKTLSVTQ